MIKKIVPVMILTLLLVSILTLAFNIQSVKASGTIYIRADGSVDPPTANITTTDNVTYTFTANINDSIVVERNNIIIDGNGYMVQGTGAVFSKGINMSSITNVTVENINIKNFVYGIFLDCSSNNIISGNNITANNPYTTYGVYLRYSLNNTVSGNNLTNNYEGVYLGYSLNNTVSGNRITDNGEGVYLVDSSNNIISGNNITDNGIGIFLYASSGNTVSGNNVANNFNGIGIGGSSNNNIISGNTITNNHNIGVWVDASSGNTVSGNNVANHFCGIWLVDSSNNNTVSGNNITNHNIGVWVDASSGNVFFHNNLVDNPKQVELYGSGYVNSWDNGCEGNYWSNYNGTDSDDDGIGDTPYVIDGNNTDRYPLMNPYWLPGDVNHNLKIDIYDVVMITGIYRSEQGDPNWNCHSDIAEPYEIINIYDVVTCTGHYGKEYTT